MKRILFSLLLIGLAWSPAQAETCLSQSSPPTFENGQAVPQVCDSHGTQKVMREVGKAEIALSQRQDDLNKIEAQIQAARNKHAEMQSAVEHMKSTNTEQRMELQALLQEERRIREQERADHLKVQEQRKQELRDEKARLDKIKQDREQAEKQLDGLRADLSKRLQTLQGLAS